MTRRSVLLEAAGRVEKRAMDMSSILGAAGSGFATGGLPFGLIGAFTARKGGWKQMAHHGLVGTLVSGIPSAFMSGHSQYQADKEREEAMKRYQAQGGYGSEF